MKVFRDVRGDDPCAVPSSSTTDLVVELSSTAKPRGDWGLNFGRRRPNSSAPGYSSDVSKSDDVRYVGAIGRCLEAPDQIDANTAEVFGAGRNSTIRG